jgi:hypothetical protein
LEDASYFLSNCKNLKYLDISKFTTKNLKNYTYIYENVSSEITKVCNKEIYDTNFGLNNSLNATCKD